MSCTLQGIIEWGKNIPAVYITDGDLSKRQVPYESLMLQRAVISHFNFRTIVEIGSSRGPLRHYLHSVGSTLTCCNDGHSSHHWYETDCVVHSVDIDLKMMCLPQRDNLHFYNCDGIEFLKSFDGTIDFLYLDAWDALAHIPYAEKHLEAFEAAESKLSSINMVSIDDTDCYEGGKGRLLIPKLLDLGYLKIVEGRQSVFLKIPV